MPQLHKKHTAIRAVGVMAAARRVAQVGAGRVHAVLVGEGPFQDEDFLPARVGMRREGGPGRVPYDARGQAERFVTHQVAPLDPRGRGRFPGEVSSLKGNGLGEVSAQRHGKLRGRGQNSGRPYLNAWDGWMVNVSRTWALF